MIQNIIIIITIVILAFVIFIAGSTLMKLSKKKDQNENLVFENNTNDKKDIVKDINVLKKMYDEGTLSKEEFEKAKEKILS